MNSQPRILLSTAILPYPIQPWHDSATDISRQRFTKGQDIFTMEGHAHLLGPHIIAQNISVPSVVLDHPTRENFENELRKSYEYVGICALAATMDQTIEMCRLVRKGSPRSKIILGGYAASSFRAYFPEDLQRKLVDYIVVGEGVRFFRELLGDPVDEPITQYYLPRWSNALWWLDKHPVGQTAALASAVGCGREPGCDFCSTNVQFGSRRIQLSSPKHILEAMKLMYQSYPEVNSVMLFEEDQDKEFIMELGRLIREDPEIGLDKLDIFVLISIENLKNYEDLDDLARAGVGSVFCGMESKFAPQEGYQKRRGDEARFFQGLRQRGIAPMLGWMAGFDFHDRINIHEDIEYMIHFEPVTHQFTIVSPIPGTPLYERLREEGRLEEEFEWVNVGFYAGANKFKNFHRHELFNIVNEAYQRFYNTLGPTLMRQLEVDLNGYEFFKNHPDPVLRKERTLLHKKKAFSLYPMIRACEQFAPNGGVRRRIKQLEMRWRRNFGEPTSAQKIQSKFILAKATMAKLREMVDPRNRYIREEPCKKYIYKGYGWQKGDGLPYKVIYPNRDNSYERRKSIHNVENAIFEQIVRLANRFDRSRGVLIDPDTQKAAKGVKSL